MAIERTTVEVPFPDPQGLLQGEAEALGSPVVPVDPLAGLCKRWLGGIFEARERAVQNYARALEEQPLSPEVRARAIVNYDMALRTRFSTLSVEP
jgi:hypothetical protein